MATKKPKNQTMQVRVSDDHRRKFGGTSAVLRELVIGFIEDRVIIQMPKGTIYHVETE